MRKRIRIVDERTVQESNSLYRHCWNIFMIILFIDWVVKVNKVEFTLEGAQVLWLKCGFETIILFVLPLVNLIMLASRGILIGKNRYAEACFPWKYYLARAALMGLIIAVSAFIFRPFFDEGMTSSAWFSSLIQFLFALSFALLLSIVFYVVYYFVFMIAKVFSLSVDERNEK